MRRILVASNAIQTMDNEMTYLIIQNKVTIMTSATRPMDK